MSALSAVIAAVQESDRLDASGKALAVAFLQAAGPAVIGLGEQGLAEALGAAAAGGDVMRAVMRNLDANGVAALLAATESQMAGLAERHAVEVQAARAALQTLESAALGVLARVLIGVL